MEVVVAVGTETVMLKIDPEDVPPMEPAVWEYTRK
jgi:hypothetical protein